MVSRDQLLAAGMSGSGISRAVERGWLGRALPGVYALTHVPLSAPGRATAALFYAGEGAALSHATAGWWWELIEVTPAVIHVSCRARPRRRPGIRFHRPRSIEAVRHRGLQVTTVDRTLLDIAATMRDADVRRALAQADFRGLLERTAVGSR